MKKLLALSILASVLLLPSMVSAQSEDETNPKDEVVVKFDKGTHDYGQIELGSDGTCEFRMTNSGTEALLIKRVKASCGCTVPSFSKDPVPPGGTALISVRYNTKRMGPFAKDVTVFSNAGVFTLKIKGTVIAGRVE